MKLRKYAPEDAAQWNQYVQSSKNGTFLFQRSYMDYHAERFPDHSLIAISESGSWTAVLPATTQKNVFSTHAGLTYGGWVTNAAMTCPDMMCLFDQLLEYLELQGFTSIRYKCIPYIYHRLAAQEDLYALFRNNAVIYRRDALSVIDLRSTPTTQERRRRGAKKAARSLIEIRLEQNSTENFAAFWNCLESNLQFQFDRKPTHSLLEIQKLRSLHPDHIRLHAAYAGDKLCAGVLVYLSEPVCHIQYISATTDGKQTGALDLLFFELIKYYQAQKSFSYLDFGISNEHDGRHLNLGLIEQKEGFGARTVAHDFYELALSPLRHKQNMNEIKCT